MHDVMKLGVAMAGLASGRAVYYGARGFIPLALPATVLLVSVCRTIVRRQEDERGHAGVARCGLTALEAAHRVVVADGAINFEGAVLEEEHVEPCTAANSAAASSTLQPLPVVLLEENFPVGLNELFRTVMKPNPTFAQQHFHACGYLDITVGPWVQTSDGSLERRQDYTTHVKNRLLGSTSSIQCHELWHMHNYCRIGFSATCEVRTPKVPFGETFHQELQWKATSDGPMSSHLLITAQVVFSKRIIGISNIIQSQAEGGMKETYIAYSKLLRQFLDTPSSGGKGTNILTATRTGSQSRVPTAPEVVTDLALISNNSYRMMAVFIMTAMLIMGWGLTELASSGSTYVLETYEM